MAPRRRSAQRRPKKLLSGKSKSKRGGQSLADRLRAITVGDAVDAAVSGVRALQHLSGFNTEVKFVDTSLAPAAQTWAGTVTPISLVAQGATVTSRDGNSIRTHGMSLSWTADCPNATTDTARLILFCDLEQNGVAPVPADLLQVTGTALAPLSAYNADNAARFVVLFDSGPRALYPAGNGATGSTEVIGINHHIRYTGAAGLIANAKEGNLFVLTIADIAAAGPVMSFYSRVNFVDN